MSTSKSAPIFTGGGFNGGGIKPSSPYSASPFTGGNYSYTQGEGITYTGPNGESANANLTPDGNYIHFIGPNGGEALRNPQTGRTLYDGTNTQDIGQRAAGTSTVNYLQRNPNGTVSAYSYDWRTGDSNQYGVNRSNPSDEMLNTNRQFTEQEIPLQMRLWDQDDQVPTQDYDLNTYNYR